MREICLKAPLREDEVRNLNVGDIVYFDGKCYTARTLFHVRALEKNIVPPLDFEKMNLMVHVGPVMKQTEEGWIPLSVDPTSSYRFEKFGSRIIKKLKIRAIIGKTTMGPETMNTMKEFGCIHLSKIGIYGNVLASKVKKVIDVYFREELGNTEATWVLEVENFGPFIVDIDTKGRNYFSQIESEVKGKLNEFYRYFGISKNFVYTEM